MTRKKHALGMPAGLKKGISFFKGGLKLSTHVFTVAGIVVASTPIIPGLEQLAQNHPAGAADLFRANTIGNSSSVIDAAKNAAINVGIPIAVGLGLIWGGSQLRKRIGN